jgi:uncharacterized membrane protein
MARSGRPSILARLTTRLRATTIAGFLLLVPLVLTVLILRFLFNVVDGILQPAVEPVVRDLLSKLGIEMSVLPGLGVLALVVLIYVAGVFAESVVARSLIRRVQNILNRTPLVGTIYTASSRLFASFGGSWEGQAERTGFRKVVTVEYPRANSWTIGFLTGTTLNEHGDRYGVVYIPTAPMPNSGWVAILPIEDVYDTNLSVQEAMSFVLSGGILAPEAITGLGGLDRLQTPDER